MYREGVTVNEERCENCRNCRKVKGACLGVYEYWCEIQCGRKHKNYWCVCYLRDEGYFKE